MRERSHIGKYLDPNGMPGELYHHRLSDLITHTFICGGSGSGKTVMGKAIIEEAALKGVPDYRGSQRRLVFFGTFIWGTVSPSRCTMDRG